MGRDETANVPRETCSYRLVYIKNKATHKVV